MKAKILDERNDGDANCFLCRVSLADYINSLPKTYQDYEIQREIVSNVYLDHLVDTVLNRRHIPPIVLIVETGAFAKTNGFLEIGSFKILDGLQRTFRLQSIWNTVQYCVNNLNVDENYLSWNKFKFSRTFSIPLSEIDSNTEVLRSVVESFQRIGKDGLLDAFRDNQQWFEIWTGLSPKEEVRKMLTLNAGHKPVKTRHQLELLFLNLLPILKEGEGKEFKLVREREISSTQFSKGREPGTFHFAHIVTSLISFLEGKPIAPSADLIQEIQSGESVIDPQSALGDLDFLKSLVGFLVQTDRLLADQYGNAGILWMGREVSLAGLLGALGAISKSTSEDRIAVLNRFIKVIQSNPQILNLAQFESVRNSLDLSKVNIGNTNRAAVFSAIKKVIDSTSPSQINWRQSFGVEES